MAFKILLTESRSTLGAALLKGFENLSLSVDCPDFTDDKWADSCFMTRYLSEVCPAVVINTAALVDASVPHGALERESVLPQVCRDLDLTLIHLSSHRVFSERQRNGEVLSEQDEPQPDHDWGHHLASLEKLVLGIPRGIVVRLPWLLDSPDGLIYQTARALLHESGIKVSDVWRGTPVFVEDVVRVLIAIVQQILCGAENWGVFHFHSSDSCSEAEFSDYIARILHRKGCTIGPISVVKSEARFFAGNGWLVGNRCTNCFGVQFRSWRQGTKGRLERWLDKRIECGEVVLQLNTNSDDIK